MKTVYSSIMNRWLYGKDVEDKSLVFKEGYDDPTYMTFKIEFGDWGASVLDRSIIQTGTTVFRPTIADYDALPIGLLDCPYPNGKDQEIYWQNEGQNNFTNISNGQAGIYSAFSYLRSRNEDTRARYLYYFVNGLFDIQKNYPFLFKKISGISSLDAFNPKDGQRLKLPAKITVECFESLNLKIRTLMEFYRKAAWDDVYQRWILPENMRQFKMIIYVFERRIFQDVKAINKNNSKNALITYADLNADIPVKAYECCPCEFSIGESTAWGNDYSSGTENNEETSKIVIEVKNVKTYFKNNLLNDELSKLYNNLGNPINQSNDLSLKIDALMIYDLVDNLERAPENNQLFEDVGSLNVNAIENTTMNSVKALFLNKNILLENEEADSKLYSYIWGFSTAGNFVKDDNISSDREKRIRKYGGQAGEFELSVPNNDPTRKQYIEDPSGASAPLALEKDPLLNKATHGLLKDTVYKKDGKIHFRNQFIEEDEELIDPSDPIALEDSPLLNKASQKLVNDDKSRKQKDSNNPSNPIALSGSPLLNGTSKSSIEDIYYYFDGTYDPYLSAIEDNEFYRGGWVYTLTSGPSYNPDKSFWQNLGDNIMNVLTGARKLALISGATYIHLIHNCLYPTYYFPPQAFSPYNKRYGNGLGNIKPKDAILDSSTRSIQYADESTDPIMLNNTNKPKDIILDSNKRSVQDADEPTDPIMLNNANMPDDKIDPARELPELDYRTLEPERNLPEQDYNNLGPIRDLPILDYRMLEPERIQPYLLYRELDPERILDEQQFKELNEPRKLDEQKFKKLVEPRELDEQKFKKLDEPRELNEQQYKELEPERIPNKELLDLLMVARTLPGLLDITLEEARKLPKQELLDLKDATDRSVPSFNTNKSVLLDAIDKVDKTNDKLLELDKGNKEAEDKIFEILKNNKALANYKLFDSSTGDSDELKKANKMKNAIAFTKDLTEKTDKIKNVYVKNIIAMKETLKTTSKEIINALPLNDNYIVKKGEKDNNNINSVLISLNDIDQLNDNMKFLSIKDNDVEKLSFQTLIKIHEEMQEAVKKTNAIKGLTAVVKNSVATNPDAKTREKAKQSVIKDSLKSKMTVIY